MEGKASSLGLLDRLDFSKVVASVILLVLFWPLLELLVSTGLYVANGEASLGLVLPFGRRFTLLFNSIGLAGSVAVSVLAIGFLCGSLLLGEEKGLLGAVKWCFLLTAPVPPYIHALTWSSFMRLVQSVLGGYGDWISLSGFPMSYCVNVLAYLPLGVGMVLVGLMLVETPAVDAARVTKGDYKALLRVVAPLMISTFFTIFGLVFILVITDFSVPTLFSFNVYSLEVFSATNEPANSVLLSIPTLVTTLVLLVYSLKGLRSTAQSSSVGRLSGFGDWVLPGWFRVFQQLAFGLAVVQVTLLVGGLIIETGSLSSLWFALTAAGDDMVTSTVISGSSAMLGAFLGYLFAERLDKEEVWWLLLSVPLTLPASLIGISLIQTYSGLPLYGTMWMPVVATVTRFMPLSAIIIYAQKRGMDPLLFSAADLFSDTQSEALFKVKLPLQKYGIAASALILFALSLGELGSTLLVIPPGNETLTIRIFNYLHYGGTEEVAGLCLAMVAIMMTLAGLAGYVYNKSVQR